MVASAIGGEHHPRNGAARMKIFNPFADMPDNPLTRAIKEGYKPLAYAGGFSLVSNLLYLALPIFTFQIYGRVLSSYSVPTLLVLTFMVLLAFLISGLIDDFRAKVLINYGVIMDQRVSGRVFSALFDTVIRGNPAARSQALRDLDAFRQMLTGPAFGTMFDLPWMPVFMIVLLIMAIARARSTCCIMRAASSLMFCCGSMLLQTLRAARSQFRTSSFSLSARAWTPMCETSKRWLPDPGFA